jgi:hypothetical protein
MRRGDGVVSVPIRNIPFQGTRGKVGKKRKKYKKIPWPDPPPNPVYKTSTS